MFPGKNVAAHLIGLSYAKVPSEERPALPAKRERSPVTVTHSVGDYVCD